MIETSLRAYLERTLNVPCSFEWPSKEKEPSKRRVILERTSGRSRLGLAEASFVIQAYAPTLYLASVLNRQVRQAMSSFEREEGVVRVELETDYQFTDVERRLPRYQGVYHLKYYEGE